MEILIKVNGDSYPCKPTMGAMLRFRELTGKEIDKMDATSISELCTFLFCCVASACNREKKPFTMSLMDFADQVSPEDMAEWQRSISREAEPVEPEEDDEKKSLPESLSS